MGGGNNCTDKSTDKRLISFGCLLEEAVGRPAQAAIVIEQCCAKFTEGSAEWGRLVNLGHCEP